ncbi:MAG: CerR family C-terminal domain-containing protein [Candidatus Sumerlaeota bacterium]|nr:CerR family C-terminal domain-containing protein [Candidatus Sumerlaeota bacterium]
MRGLAAHAAAEVFAQNGYRNATFREICQRAQANIAAVNYHFGDKERFYSAVVEHVIEQEGDVLREFQSRMETPAPPEERLRTFVHLALNSLLGASPPTRLIRLMAHEMMEPTPALDFMVERVVQPTHQNMREIVREILGEKADERMIADCAHSITGQCFIFHHARAVIARLGTYPAHDPATIEHLAEHVAQFSLEALHSIREGLRGFAVTP